MKEKQHYSNRFRQKPMKLKIQQTLSIYTVLLRDGLNHTTGPAKSIDAVIARQI